MTERRVPPRKRHRRAQSLHCFGFEELGLGIREQNKEESKIEKEDNFRDQLVQGSLEENNRIRQLLQGSSQQGPEAPAKEVIFDQLDTDFYELKRSGLGLRFSRKRPLSFGGGGSSYDRRFSQPLGCQEDSTHLLGGQSLIQSSPDLLDVKKRLQQIEYKYDEGSLQKIEEDAHEMSLAMSKGSIALKTLACSNSSISFKHSSFKGYKEHPKSGFKQQQQQQSERGLIQTPRSNSSCNDSTTIRPQKSLEQNLVSPKDHHGDITPEINHQSSRYNTSRNSGNSLKKIAKRSPISLAAFRNKRQQLYSLTTKKAQPQIYVSQMEYSVSANKKGQETETTKSALDSNVESKSSTSEKMKQNKENFEHNNFLRFANLHQDLQKLKLKASPSIHSGKDRNLSTQNLKMMKTHPIPYPTNKKTSKKDQRIQDSTEVTGVHLVRNKSGRIELPIGKRVFKQSKKERIHRLVEKARKSENDAITVQKRYQRLKPASKTLKDEFYALRKLLSVGKDKLDWARGRLLQAHKALEA